MSQWDEQKHPRDKSGRFATSDGIGGTHEETPAESKRLREIGIENKIELSKQEYGVLRQEVFRKSAEQKGKVKPVNYAYTANYFYIYSTKGDDDFTALLQLDIEDEGEAINYYESIIRGNK